MDIDTKYSIYRIFNKFDLSKEKLYNSIMKKNNYIYDVVIIGGGTSGCSAAYNCAKNNLKTLLVEKNNYLGGLITGGLVVPVMKSSVKNLNTSFYKRLVNVAKKYNAQQTYSDNNDGWFAPELLKIVLEDILTTGKIKNNLDILLESRVNNIEIKNNTIKAIEIESNMLSIPIEAKYYIDCSGSGEFSKKCGCKFLNDTSLKQQNSLRFNLCNVDFEKFCNFIEKEDLNRNITNTNRNDINNNDILQFTTASVNNGNEWALDKFLKKGVKDGILKENDRDYFQIFSIAASKNQVAFNCPRFTNTINDPFKHTKSIMDAKKAIWRLYNFVKKYFPGFENSEICNIADITGIREERRLKTKYIYKNNDLTSSKTFKNPVLKANYPIDIHNNNKSKLTLNKVSKYELPVESLMSADISNLFAAGKLAGAEFQAHSALRVQKSCMSMGEGIANYIANKNNKNK